MKKLIFSLLALLAIGFTTTAAQAQTQKVAYVIEDSIMRALPQFKTQQKIIESYAKQFKTQIDSKQQAMQQKYQFLLQNQNSMSPQEQQEKQEELQTMQNEVIELQQRAQQGVAKKNQELMQPLVDKITKGIEEVAKAEGYNVVMPKSTFIFSGGGADITGKVIEKVKAMK
ncbi:OmpH family outer membrane protein [Limibacter armeniacum]|uniref:OmpH family outer membrane protein n=1 Tax=Limibacter armeniacum TaxID=466084 RepID=UPI002FE5A96D